MRVTILLGAACAVVSVQLACAADLGTKAPVYQAPPPLLYNWSGFYVGANIGYGWNNIDNTTSSLTTGAVDSTVSSERAGVFGGGQIGYNYLINPNFLIGIEADLGAADLTGSYSDCIDAFRCQHTESKNDWFGTLRGRIGYVQNNWLLFATGGVAWVHGTATRTLTAAVNPALIGQSRSASGTDIGWMVGGGVEYAFAPNWSVNVEYRYMQVDTGRDFLYSASIADVHVDATDHISTVRIGLNYHFH